MSWRFAKVIILLPCILAVGCGVYTFSSSSLGNVKTVAIPLFGNETTESGLREPMSDRLAQAFVNDNTLNVVREQQADAILRGTIKSYRRDAHTYTQAEVVNEYICRLSLAVEFSDRKSGKIIWEEKEISNFGVYNANTETEDDGKSKAIGKLVEDILNKTVKGW